MSPLLALLLCLVLIVILFRLDTSQNAQPSSALLIPTIWILIIGSRMVSQWLQLNSGSVTEDAYSEGSVLDRNIFLVLIVAALAVVASRGIGLAGVASANRWLFVFWLYSAFSILWSDFPDVSFKRYIKDVGNTLMVLIVLTERDPIEAISTLFKRCAYILIPLSVVMFKYFPHFGRSYSRWEGRLSITGVTNNKNSLGVLCAICGIVIFWNLLSIYQNEKLPARKRHLWVQLFILILTTWVLIVSSSATSLVCFIIGIAIIAFVELRKVRRVMLYGAPLIVFLLGGYILISDSVLGVFTGAVGRDESLTGRTDVWRIVLEMVQNPIIGCGYNSFFLGDRLSYLWSLYTWRMTEAHNGYLEIFLDLGAIGLVLIIGVLISSLGTTLALVRNEPKAASLKLAFLVSVILYNITESAFRPGLLMYFVFALVVIQLPRRANKLAAGLDRSISVKANHRDLFLRR